MTDSQQQLISRFGLIVLLVLVAYGNTVTHGFVWDDYDIIVNNPLLEKLSNIPQFFLSEDKVIAATGYYRPMTYISFALDRAIWGLNPIGFNITNLVLHILVALLFYTVTAELFKKEQLALVAALIFALHPIAGETVNFHAGGRNTLLSACFALLSLLFYLKGKRVAAIACFTCAIFSKEFALLLPLIFFFHDYRLQRKNIQISTYIPYLAPIICYLTLRTFAVQKANFLATFRFSRQLWLTPYLVVRYLVNMLFPFRLKVLYDEQTGIFVCILCFLVVLLLTAAIFFYRKHADLVFADFWFLLFLLPVVNIIPLVGNSLIADRYAYFSLMGFSLGLAGLLSRVHVRFMTVGLVMLCAVYALVDFRQNSIWEDEVALFTRMMKDAPNMFIGSQNLGLYYYNKGDMASALRYLAIASEKADIPPLILTGTASIFIEANKDDKAEPLLTRALAEEPANPEPYVLLQRIYEQRGNRALAEAYRVKAQQSIPGIEGEFARMAEVFSREGEKFIAEGKYISARNILWRALLAKADSVPALVAMGRLAYEQKAYADAIRYLEKAVALDPSSVSARNTLSTVNQTR